MFKKQQIKIVIGGLLISLAALGSACSSGTATAQTPRVRAAESPTPEYKPPKRVSRDIIDSDRKKEEAPKAKTKK